MERREISWSFWAIIIFIIIGTIEYVDDVNAGNIKTTIVTWIILITASLLNLSVAVMKKGLRALQSNIVIIMGVAGQSVILVFVIRTGASTEIMPIDVVVFVGSLLGFTLYLWKREYAMISVIAINVAIIIGFVPMWLHLRGGGITESLTAWVYITIAASIGSYKLILQREYLDLVYPLRATLTSGIVVGLSLWNMYS